MKIIEKKNKKLFLHTVWVDGLCLGNRHCCVKLRCTNSYIKAHIIVCALENTANVCKTLFLLQISGVE